MLMSRSDCFFSVMYIHKTVLAVIMGRKDYVKGYANWRAGQDEKITKLIIEMREIRHMLNQIANELWGENDGKKK